MSQALQQMIRQAEIQKLQMELNVRFSKNLALFEKRMPKVFAMVKDKTPKDWVIRLDQNDNLNLYSQSLKQFLYDKSPMEYCEKQVQDFTQFSKPRRFRIVRNKPYNDEHLHIPFLNDLIDDFENADKVPRAKKTPDFMTLLIASGVGMGFQLSKLINQIDIQNILIYEGDIDVFLASMQVIDWATILDHFAQKGKTIALCIGVEPRKALAQIEYFIQSIGLFTMAYSFMLPHTRRKEEMEFIEAIEDDLRAFIGGVGYFDDEQIGLAHAYHNMRSKNAVFDNGTYHKRNTPVLIIGNGPSLDEHADFIREHQEHSVLLSCGTGLTSLLRMGIRPDFHVEMERCLLVKDLIEYGTTPEQLEGISLLCLHPVSPATIDLFDEACYAIKPNDAGSILIHEYFKPKKLYELFFCNPTVSNCGLSLAVSMGFETIHLIGIDFGVKTSQDHHSKHSIYGDMEKQLKTSDPTHRFFKTETSVTKEGNLGGEVMVNPVLNMARVSMERYLSTLGPKFPNLRVINSNKGAKIAGTEPTPLDQVKLDTSHDKIAEIEAIKKDHFYHATNDAFEKKDKNEILKYFYNIESELYLSDAPSSELEMYQEFRRIYSHIDHKKDKITNTLMKGSVNFFLTSIAENAFLCEKEADRKARYLLGRERYNEFIRLAFEKMRKDPFALDQTRSPLIKKMEEAAAAEREKGNSGSE